MPMMEVSRWSHCISNPVTFTTAIGTTGGFSLASYAGAMLLIDSVNGSASTGTATLTFHVARSEVDPTPYLAQENGINVTLDVQPGRAYPVPDALFAAAYVEAVSNNGPVVCKIFLKG